MSWLDEHPAVKAVDAEIAHLTEARAKWQARMTGIDDQYAEQVRAWQAEAERAAWENLDPPSKPQPPESLEDRQNRAFYWTAKLDELNDQRQKVIGSLEGEWTREAMKREAELLAKAKPLLQQLAGVGQALDGLLAEQRTVAQAARGTLPQHTIAFPRDDGQPVATKLDWYAQCGPAEILRMVLEGRGSLIRLDEVSAANEAAMEGRTA